MLCGLCCAAGRDEERQEERKEEQEQKDKRRHRCERYCNKTNMNGEQEGGERSSVSDHPTAVMSALDWHTSVGDCRAMIVPTIVKEDKTQLQTTRIGDAEQTIEIVEQQRCVMSIEHRM